MHKKIELHGLTILRGIAALMVAIHHFGLLALPLRDTVFGPALGKFGVLGMSLFFTLSGFVISGGFKHEVQHGLKIA
jgi:peptidoglycan/LPS O-acetylase OafA/YrhL